jgi:hypothetical protein
MEQVKTCGTGCGFSVAAVASESEMVEISFAELQDAKRFVGCVGSVPELALW